LIGLNQLLQSQGVALGRARLVRHQDNRAAEGRSPHDLWMAEDGRFDLYQRIQRKDRFKRAEWLVSFVATPLDETLSVGVYRVRGVGTAPAGMTDPTSGHDVAGMFLYDLALDEPLRDYAGRIVVDWGKGFRSWVRRPDRRDKPVIEIRRRAVEPPFLGFDAFTWRIRELASVPASWRTALSAVAGVYVLVCRSTGGQYVGLRLWRGWFLGALGELFQARAWGQRGHENAAGS
jgi:hypothetical protein